MLSILYEKVNVIIKYVSNLINVAILSFKTFLPRTEMDEPHVDYQMKLIYWSRKVSISYELDNRHWI